MSATLRQRQIKLAQFIKDVCTLEGGQMITLFKFQELTQIPIDDLRDYAWGKSDPLAIASDHQLKLAQARNWSLDQYKQHFV